MFIPLKNLGFINYVQNYDDLYILKIHISRTNSDGNEFLSYAKSYDTVEIVKISAPKNVLKISTVNSKNWTPGTGSNYGLVVSS